MKLKIVKYVAIMNRWGHVAEEQWTFNKRIDLDKKLAKEANDLCNKYKAMIKLKQ